MPATPSLEELPFRVSLDQMFVSGRGYPEHTAFSMQQGSFLSLGVKVEPFYFQLFHCIGFFKYDGVLSTARAPSPPLASIRPDYATAGA